MTSRIHYDAKTRTAGLKPNKIEHVGRITRYCQLLEDCLACGQGESPLPARHVDRESLLNHYCQLLEDCMACGQGESLLSTVGRLHGMWTVNCWKIAWHVGRVVGRLHGMWTIVNCWKIAWHVDRVNHYCQLLEDCMACVDRVNHYCQLLEDCMACGQGESLLSTVGRLHGMWTG